MNKHEMSLPKNLLGALLNHLKLERNALFSAWILPEQAAEAETWWSEITEDKRSSCLQLLEAMAAPALLATFTMVEDETTVLLRCLVATTAPDSLTYLIREEQEHFLAFRLDHRDEAVDAIWNLLVGDFPLWDIKWGATLSREAFFTLLAASDLQKRKDIVALLEHTVLGPEFFPTELGQMIARSFEHRDLRWLLPFFVTVLPHAPKLDNLCDPGKALEDLCRAELLQSAEQGVFRWSPSGEFLTEHWQRRLSVAGLQILGADHDGSPVASHVGFLRSRKFLWYFDLNNPTGEVLLSTPAADLCQELLDELLIPVGEPSKAAKSSESTATQVLFCPYCGGKLAVLDARFCNCCGKQLKENG